MAPTHESQTIKLPVLEATEPAALSTPGLETPRPEIVLPLAGPNPVSAWRPPPYPIPLAILPSDHFYFGRPIPSGDVNWPNPRYRYGSTAFGEESIHTGVDLGARLETSVIAAGKGEVVWVGYGLYRGVPDETDPYGLAIAIRHDFGHQNQTLYTVYAHLETAEVWLGQRVSTGDPIGTVGITGHTSGPHLHYEVRKGENRYLASRNPELWTVPAEGWGVLAGQIKDTIGRALPEHQILVKSIQTEQIWEVWTYAPGTIQPDESYQENFVIGDLPAGPYEVQINFAGKTHSAIIYVRPGQTNLIEFEGRDGFIVEEQGVATNLEFPPYP